MTAVVWTLVGVLTAMFGVLATALFFAIGRVDGLRSEFNGRFEGLHDYMREVRTDISELRTNAGELRTDVAGLRTDVAGLRSEMRDLRTVVGDVEARLAAAGG